jgi:hypothetical protein
VLSLLSSLENSRLVKRGQLAKGKVSVQVISSQSYLVFVERKKT